MNNMNQEDVWDKIAESWSENSYLRVPEIAEFLGGKKGRILDMGCGNCRHLISANKEGNELYGIDFSANMLRVAEKCCKENNMKVNLKKADVSDLPFTDNFFDVVICIAVLHTIKEGGIEKPLNEIKRVLKPGAPALILVWHKGEKGERLKPWFEEHEGKKIFRYYYFFDEDEIKDKIKSTGLQITKSYIVGRKGKKNILIEVRKPL